MTQAMTDTTNKLAPRHARMMAKINAIAPAIGALVASIIEGKVIAASVK